MSYDILVIASPADAVGALHRIASALPQHLPVPVVCLQAFASGVGVEDIIPEASPLCARYATQGEAVASGCALFAPPRQSIAITPDRRIVLGPLHDRTHGATPPADRLLVSAAQAYGPGVLALILTGWGADGFDGGRAVKEAGGTLIVQTRDGMPFRDCTEALTRTRLADETLDSHVIAHALTRWLFGEPRPVWKPPSLPAANHPPL